LSSTKRKIFWGLKNQLDHHRITAAQSLGNPEKGVSIQERPTPSALSQTDGTGQRSSLAKIAWADLVQTNGLGLALDKLGGTLSSDASQDAAGGCRHPPISVPFGVGP
jgi:hypothetical protein